MTNTKSAGDSATPSENPASGADVIAKIRSLWLEHDPWDYDPGELASLQLEALKARFEARRDQLRVLKQRAIDQTIHRIDRLQDTVPLLFSHTNYKSYSRSFVAKGRWDLMTRWMGNLSTVAVDDVDLSDVKDIDGWVDAMRAAGHWILSSSGTTGQTSFVNYTPSDRQLQRITIAKLFEVSTGQRPEKKFQAFFAGPKFGPTMASEQIGLTADLFAATDGDHYISERTNTIAELDRMAALRRAIAAGTATADMIRTVEEESVGRAAKMNQLMQLLFDKILANRDKPILMLTVSAALWRLVEYGRSKGVADGGFHPDTIIRTGGGKKGAKLPENFISEVDKFLGLRRDRWVESYGMTELTSQFVKCSEGCFHYPPSVIPLILNKEGDTLIDKGQGVVEGRGGFFDICVEGYWGGIISGDRLKVNFETCGCGRKSPSVVEVSRYSDLPEGDDKLTCAGHIDTYIRGFTGGDDAP